MATSGRFCLRSTRSDSQRSSEAIVPWAGVRECPLSKTSECESPVPFGFVKHPCESFSLNDELCGQCEEWWNARVADFARELGQEREWSPWATPFLGDGVTRHERGNTITSQRSRRLDRAFRVILMTEPTVRSGFSGWVQPRDEALAKRSTGPRLSCSSSWCGGNNLSTSRWRFLRGGCAQRPPPMRLNSGSRNLHLAISRPS